MSALEGAKRSLRRRAGPAVLAVADRYGFSRDPGLDGPATDRDVVTAYRLLFDREPDPGGAELYRRRVAEGISRAELADEFIHSSEFARRWPDLVGAHRPERETVPVAGFVITVEPTDWAVGGPISRNRDYEPESSALIRSLLAPDGVFVDVGANIGWYSLLAAAVVGPGGHVLSVEPNLRNCSLIEASREDNGFSQIDLFQGAVSDTPGWLALETDASNGRVLPLGPVDGTTRPIPCSYAVPATTLDDLLDDRGLLHTVDAMKVDVEGVETAVFRGATRLLSGTRPPIVFEWYPDALRGTGATDPAEPLDLLRSHGYEISVVGPPSQTESGNLSNEEIEAVRIARHRDLLDLFARHPAPSPR